MLSSRRTAHHIAALAGALTLAIAPASAGAHARHHALVDRFTITRAFPTSVVDSGADSYTGPALAFEAHVTAHDEHDTVLLYATNQPCLHNYDAIEQAVQSQASVQLFDEDLGAEDYTRTGRHSYTISTSIGDVLPGQFTTVCGILYDAPGDPRWPGHPHNVPARHVWRSAEHAITAQ